VIRAIAAALAANTDVIHCELRAIMTSSSLSVVYHHKLIASTEGLASAIRYPGIIDKAIHAS
jgi:hypothetical protein